MRWTKKTPTKAGWYWFRKEKGLNWTEVVHVRSSRGLPTNETMARNRIVRTWIAVEGYGPRSKFVVGTPGDGCIEYLYMDSEHFSDGEWAGPIKEPTES